jgi:hypothetical protein
VAAGRIDEDNEMIISPFYLNENSHTTLSAGTIPE